MAQTIFIAGGPKRQIPVYIMKKFDFIQMLEAVQKFKITALAMVPPIVVVRGVSTQFYSPSQFFGESPEPRVNLLTNYIGPGEISTHKEVRPQQCS
jgi:hypothetical protein